jgi:hypothetical protein
MPAERAPMRKGRAVVEDCDLGFVEVRGDQASNQHMREEIAHSNFRVHLSAWRSERRFAPRWFASHSETVMWADARKRRVVS